jgi:hypothetical protein
MRPPWVNVKVYSRNGRYKGRATGLSYSICQSSSFCRTQLRHAGNEGGERIARTPFPDGPEDTAPLLTC